MALVLFHQGTTLQNTVDNQSAKKATGIYIQGLKTSHALFELTETTSTVYINGRMYGNGVDEHFDTDLTGHEHGWRYKRYK